MLNVFSHSRLTKIFIISSILVSLSTIYLSEQYKLQQKQRSLQTISHDYASELSNKITRLSSAIQPISALIQSQQGASTGFSKLATKILTLYPEISSLQLHSNGIITHVTPTIGNESKIGLHTLTLDSIFNTNTPLSNDTKTTLTGALTLVPSGEEFIVRLPIYLNTPDGAVLWGGAVASIHTQELLKSLDLFELNTFNIAYKLSSLQASTNTSQVIKQSTAPITNKHETFDIKIPNSGLTLQISASNNWENNELRLIETLQASLFILSLCFLSSQTTRRHKQQKTKLMLDESEHRLHEAQDYANIGYWELLIKDNTAIWSNQMTQILGLSEDIHPGLEAMRSIVTASVFNEISNSIHPSSNKTEHYIEFPISRAADNEERWIKSSGKIIYNKAGNAEKVTGFIRDITDKKRVDLQKNINHTVLQLLVNKASLPVILNTIIELIEKSSNLKVCSILLLDELGEHLSCIAAPSLPRLYNEAINGVKIGASVGSSGTAAFTHKRVIIEDIQSHPYSAQYKELAAKAKIASCWSQPITGANKVLFGTFAVYHHSPRTPTTNDIQLIEFAAQIASIAIERSRSAEKLKLSSKVFTHTQEGISITDANNIIIDVNPAYCEITGYSREEVIGKNPSILNSGRQSAEFYSKMWQQLSEHGYWKGEMWNRKKNGELFAEQLSISSLHDENEQTTNYVGVFSDITQSKSHQDELNHMAHYDQLTELPNRALFADRFQQAIAHSKRYNKQLSVCFIDLDNFKPINDNFGHGTGDQLLIEVAKRITTCIREEDTVSRQGGDEFTLLINNIDTPEESTKTLERIHQALAKPYIIDDQIHQITASSGVTLYPQDNADIDTLLRHADQAMYQAKLLGKNRSHRFNPSEDQETIYKHHRISEIEQALKNEEFRLYYQPKVNMLTGEAFGAEALIRWYHPKKGIIPPLDFLPLIDGTELNIKLGNWVIAEALSQMNTWKKAGIILEVSVNISSHHLQSKNFFKQLADALQVDHSTDPHYLQLEILESSALSDLNAISNTIKTCQDHLGIKFALDDFGTGYSSLTHIKNLPVSTIKIDQTFVRNILSDPDDYSIIDGTIGLADAFNRTVIAEGVETTETGLMLQIMGCEQAQGYAIAKPLPANELTQWLASYQPNKQWLDHKNKSHSSQQKKAMLYRLISQHWHKQFTSLMLEPNTGTKTWPLLETHRCHCGAWIRRAEQENLFTQRWLSQLKQAHEEYHLLAQGLQLKYRQGKINEARGDLSLLSKEFDKTQALVELII